MKIRVEATAQDIVPEELERTKTFGVLIETPDGHLRTREGLITEVEDRILQSIFMRIKQDKDDLIRWHRDGNVVWATIDIIPAIDYIPQ